jgi:broad specificity phosphatase PhoE
MALSREPTILPALGLDKPGWLGANAAGFPPVFLDPPMTRTFVIRHAKPSATWGDAAGDPDPGLDAVGKAQAEAAAERLMALPADLRPTRVFSSPLARCRETAEPFARRIGAVVEIDPRFGEIPTPKALSAAQRGDWLAVSAQGTWAQIKGDLDYDAWRRSVGAALEETAGAAVFSHFVALNALMSCATGDPAVVSARPDHASITIFDVTDGGLVLVERGAEAATQVL